MALCSAHFNSWINMSIVNEGNILSAVVFRQFDNVKKLAATLLYHVNSSDKED